MHKTSRLALFVEELDEGIHPYAQLDPGIMERYSINQGDLLLVEGEHETAVIAQNSEESGRYGDRDRDVIKLTKLAMKNARVKPGDLVFVEKIELRYAESVKIAPLNFYVPIDEDNEDILSNIKHSLLSSKPPMPVHDGNEIYVLIEDIKIPFKIISVKPRGPAVITENTDIILLNKPLRDIPRVTFDDIGGLGDVINKIRDLVELPFKYSKIFSRLGIEPPRGILLHGPPGCGKTLVAKALANELGAYFIAINGPEIASKYYGESERKLREIFEIARKKAKKHPAIIFIDEIDAIAPKRDEISFGEAEKRIVAQLLTLMDGLESRGNVIVIAATNRLNAVDPALRRPGRFDIEIEIPIPNKKSRLEILQVHTRRLRKIGVLSEDVDLEKLAEITHGFTGADLAALVREAAIRAVKRTISSSTQSKYENVISEIKVKQEDFLSAYKSIIPSGLREIYIEAPNVTWSDIGGLHEVKRILRENIEMPLRNPDLYEKYGVKPPRGVLLYGPPGCGKTLLAKAIARESGVNFIAIRGPEILSKWVGESERAIREIFTKARMHAPCVVFFDDIDSIASTRSSTGDSRVIENVVTQLITEMDGIRDLDRVVVLAATNRPDLLDPALLRPGRFDKLVYIPPPDFESRLEILNIHTRYLPLSRDVDLGEIAKLTENYSGADLEALVREALLLALREHGSLNELIKREHFMKALEIVKPSLSDDLVRYYQQWTSHIKRVLLKKGLGPQIYA